MKNAIYILAVILIGCNLRQKGNEKKKQLSRDIRGRPSMEFIGIREDTLLFSSRKIKTNIYNLRFEGFLGVKKLYIVISGSTCRDCDENRSIFIFNATDTPISMEKISKYVYPGKIFDYADVNKVVFESEAYLGNFNDSLEFVMVWHQIEYIADSVKKGTYIVRVANDTLDDKYYPNVFLPMSSNTACKRIEGINVTSEP